MSSVSVIAISEAFKAFWCDLAQDLHIAIEVGDPESAPLPHPDTAAIVIAAGGAEREASEWLQGYSAPPGLPLLVVGTDPGRRTALHLVARGASDYFSLPEDLEVFRNAVVAALQRARARPAAGPNGHGDPFAGIVGRSVVMQKVLARAARLAPHRYARALILGETGTGKELLARAIHAGGPAPDAPFVAVNCSALPEHLIESELFGHERGSFTDAHAAKPGLFEVADTGTLFLDEIGDLPTALQAKLLRVLEDRQIRRVGGTKSRTVNVRILAATHEDLPRRVREGTFREDLFFRLGTIALTLPPLRDRGEDVLLIAEALLRRFAAEHGLPVPALSPQARCRLCAHPWPGNVRELSNAVERTLLLSPPGELCLEELLPPPETPPAASDGPFPFPAPLREITTAVAHATVRWCGGNRTASARQLGISPGRLRRLLNGDGDLGWAPDDDPRQPVGRSA